MNLGTMDDVDESFLNLAELGLSPSPPPRASVFIPQHQDGIQESKDGEENIGNNILGDLQAEGDTNNSQGNNESQEDSSQTNLQSE